MIGDWRLEICGNLAEEIEPAVVITERGTEDGLVATAEIMAVVLGVAVGMDGVGVDGLDAGELEFEPFMAESEVGTDQMPPSGIVIMVERIEHGGIEACSFAPFPPKGSACAVETSTIHRAVVTESLGVLSCRCNVHRFAGMEDRRKDESLTTRGLEITAYHGM